MRIANPDGTVAERLDYDAFGGRRNPVDPGSSGSASLHTPRGFTGHEYIDGTGIIHMNGRIYDQELGRFLQADPLIQAPKNMQSWNAYTYAFNNPLTYTDPTGLFSVGNFLANPMRNVTRSIMRALGPTASGLAVSVGCGMTGPFAPLCFAGANYDMTRAFGGSSSDARRSGVITAFSSWAGGQIGGGTSARVAGQAVLGGVVSELQGGKFGHGFASAGLTAMFMPQIGNLVESREGRIVLGAIVGGTISSITGGKFANGAMSGAMMGAMMGETKSNGEKGFSNGMSTADSGERFSRTAPANLYSRIVNSDLSLRLESSWTWMIENGRESGFAAFASSTDNDLPLIYRNFPPSRYNPNTGRYDYFSRSEIITALTPPHGYRLYLTFHGHPWNSGMTFLFRFPFFVTNPAGPSVADGNMARMYPDAYHVVRWMTGEIIVNGYYVPRVESEMPKQIKTLGVLVDELAHVFDSCILAVCIH